MKTTKSSIETGNTIPAPRRKLRVASSVGRTAFWWELLDDSGAVVRSSGEFPGLFACVMAAAATMEHRTAHMEH